MYNMRRRSLFASSHTSLYSPAIEQPLNDKVERSTEKTFQDFFFSLRRPFFKIRFDGIKQLVERGTVEGVYSAT